MRRLSLLAGTTCVALTGSLPAQTDLWSLRGTRPDSFFGRIAALPDLDGDGVEEFVAGETGNFWLFSLEPGRAYVYSGAERTLLYELVGDQPGDCFGQSVANAGDVDGDGTDDIIVGAMQWTDWLTTLDGYARIFSGADGSVIRTLVGSQLNAAFGSGVCGAGDVDADGYDDVLVEAQWESVNGVDYAGRVHLYSGQTGAELFALGGTKYFEYCGYALAGIGDVNQDGHDDFIVGSPGEDVNGVTVGVARVFSGRDFSVLYQFSGTFDGAGVGEGLAGGSDLNGDGVPDFAIGAPAGNSLTGFDLGRVLVYSGATGSLLQVHGGLAAWDVFGAAISMRADLDGDGIADVVVGAPFTSTDDGVVGAIYAFSGKTGSLLMSDYGKNNGGAPPFGIEFGSDFGGMLDGLRDLNGDGKDELLVSAIADLDAPGSTLGAVYLVTLADLHASWRNYGTGWPGTHCCPTLTSNAPPILGTTITLSLSNSAGFDTIALLYGGYPKAALPTNAGGTILVAPPWWISVVVDLPAGGLDLDVDIDPVIAYAGAEFDVQAMEFDPGATKRLAFTPGLELIIGGD